LVRVVSSRGGAKAIPPTPAFFLQRRAKFSEGIGKTNTYEISTDFHGRTN
jgi:hypothetical protein